MKHTLIASLLAASLTGSVFAASEADIEATFFPYKKGFPSFAGLTPGMTINKANVQNFREVLDSATVALVGKGELEIIVEEAHSVALHPNYIAATKKNADQVKLGSKPGTLEGYVAGRPFPYQPNKSDPRAGEKLAFNYKYSQIVGDSGRIYPFPWLYKDYTTGKVERQIDFDFHFISLKHRTTQDPVNDIVPNPAGVYRNIYLKVLGPQDLKNTQLLIQRFDDDTKIDESYLYLGFQRRVRRLATGQTTDSFLGSDLMIEDFEGYNGRVLDAEWKYLETKPMLMPVYRHSQWKGLGPKDADGYGMVTFHGQGACFPNIPWSLRQVHVLESIPTNPGSPISKRVMYLDSQATVFPIILTYDKKGELWKRWQVGYSDSAYHAPINKDAGILIYTTASMLDVQSRHCTALALKMQSEPTANPPSMFNVQFLRGGD